MSIFKSRRAAAPPTTPTISVVIPLYNHARYIEAALKSVLEQTSPADEIILIDDGSKDNGFALAEQMLAKVPHARFYKQENAGAHNTINRAIGISRSEYIAVLNSDDVFAPAKLERVRAIVHDSPGVGLIAGKPGIMDDNSVRQNTGIAIDWLGRAANFLDEWKLPQLALLNENFVATTSNMVFTRALWEAAGGFQPLRYCHDLDFLMFAYAQSSVFLDREHEHIVYRVHESNTIKEDLGKVRVEIAAVIAQALFASGPRLFSAGLTERDLAAFQTFLRNKQLTELLCFFQTILPTFATRAAFYEYAADARNAAAFRAAVLN
ncbi:glycosyltransferase family 2 protein [bacterium M00.F.Ca.ET.228.01.1.1]|uniref:glycosyltransferase family 2 protein n=1 Tax=Paraburkholderia phenoliruptrix TaxID=252970 RepID=UPI001092775B|nr:glycosyltransferase family A protein [Paraburkholderia phenoliruptrix]TGP43132.1 glycosyltransferase family 2 protein [bacterium M00.F.Ca.ET.228.01.1.1]TGS00571.1 glycosyltransferase family 2 protein [bacterium M00.F.Ca.ET.191.01.1.1]TGU04957.1 glycosyltransferase family 2 protein [bacterium M00.F.Ca.ET.155.01.1.1]MBW0446936.1 glycosyltransferase family 2 protein [Paraburkholderia phenoliruptrix]MBW9099432.1 glycosyltransferase family 2 protein [Paraburkholderia phenoliruptrix]